MLYEGLKDLKDRFILPEATPDSNPSWFGFLLTVREDAGFTRDEIVKHLEEHNIQTRMLFSGNLTRHPCFAYMKEGKDYRIAGDLINTDKIMHGSFWLGVYPGMTEEMVDFMIQTIKLKADSTTQPPAALKTRSTPRKTL